MNTLLDAISEAASAAKKTMAYSDGVTGRSSLSKITKSAKVEPLAIVSRDVTNLPYTPLLMNNALDMFIGYYLQAISMLTTIGGVRVAKVLDSLNPDRSLGSLLTTLESVDDKKMADTLSHFSIESYEYKLPTDFTLEDELTEIFESKIKGNEEAKEKGTMDGNAAKLKAIYDTGNLMIGKIVDITLKIEEDSHTLPVQFALTGVPLPEKTIISMLSGVGKDRTAKALWRGWRSGRLSFWKDIVFADQLVKEHKKALMEDETGVYEEVAKRARSNSIVTIASGEPSLATSSNVYIISSEVAEDIEYELGAPLTDYNTRQKLFDTSYAMILMVIDKRYERILIYINGEKVGNNISAKDLKDPKKKGGDVNLLELFQAANNKPSAQF